MCNCMFFNGGACTYEDYASGQTEDGYCGVEESADDCDTYTKEDE